MFIGLPRRTLSRLVDSLLFKVTQKVPLFPSMSISPVLETTLSEHKKMSEHKKGALYHQYDWTFTTYLDICCIWTAASRTTMVNLQWLVPTHEGWS